MWQHWRLRALWILAWAAIGGAGAAAIARSELALLRETFETDARIAHRMLSQRVAQHDAVLSTLALLQPAESAERPQQRLSSVYSQILAVEHRARDAPWRVTHDALSRAEALLRLGRTDRLSAFGELGAGVAHELNQPLTAVLASAQAARRLLTALPAHPPDRRRRRGARQPGAAARHGRTARPDLGGPRGVPAGFRSSGNSTECAA